MADTRPTLLITLVGKDRPGLPCAIFSALDAHGIEVLDIEQVLLRRRLVLGVLVTRPSNLTAVTRNVEEVAASLGLDVDLELAADLIVGPIAVRLFFTGRRIQPKMVDPMVEMALHGICRAGRRGDE